MKTFSLILCVAGLLAMGQTFAAVVTDGTMGPVVNLHGRFQIGAELGTRVGPNLFHSFETFNLGKNERAVFTSPKDYSKDISNVISRVTGGEVSRIDGVLRSRVGQADFYFINPAGVVFGPTAKIDVPASMHLSTASELRFPDGGVYSAVDPEASSLSIMPPEAYGFLPEHHGEVRFEGNGWADKNDKWSGTAFPLKLGFTWDIVAGDITVRQTHLQSEQGFMRLATMAEGEVQVSTHDNNSTHGNIHLQNAYLDVSGIKKHHSLAGHMVLNTGQLTARNSLLYADNYGNIDSPDGGIDISAHDIYLDKSLVASNPMLGLGEAGDITVHADGVIQLIKGGQISTGTGRDANADAGDITIHTDRLIVDGNNSKLDTSIFSDTYNQGDAGDVIILADKLELINNGNISSSVQENASGDGGSIVISADQVIIDNSNLNAEYADKYAMGGLIAETYGAGAAGNISIDTASLMIQGQKNALTGVFANAWPGSIGQTGYIDIRAGDWVRLRNAGFIVSLTASALNDPSQVKPQSVDIQSPVLFGDANGIISTQSFGKIPAGNINLRISEMLGLNLSIVSTSSRGGGGGNITIATPITLLSNGIIQANSSAVGGRGGLVDINTQALVASESRFAPNQNTILSPDELLKKEGIANLIQAAAPRGLSGTVTISAPQLDISGSISHLPSLSLALPPLSGSYCDLGRDSSLLKYGAGFPPRAARAIFSPAHRQ